MLSRFLLCATCSRIGPVKKPLRFAKPLLGAYRLSLGKIQNSCVLGHKSSPSLLGSHQGAFLLIGAPRKIFRMPVPAAGALTQPVCLGQISRSFWSESNFLDTYTLCFSEGNRNFEVRFYINL